MLIKIEPDACVIDSWAQGYVQAVSIENEFKKNKRGRYKQTMDLIYKLNKINKKLFSIK
jgi:hypothetical protein